MIDIVYYKSENTDKRKDVISMAIIYIDDLPNGKIFVSGSGLNLPGAMGEFESMGEYSDINKLLPVEENESRIPKYIDTIAKGLSKVVGALIEELKQASK